MTHTPGPWRVCQMEVTNRGKMWGINGDEGTSGLSGDARLAEVFSIEANAKLVAAAPELLAALKECVPWLESMPLATGDQLLRDKAARDLYNAQAAIAKAEGK